MERGINGFNLHYMEFIPDLIVHKKEFGESFMQVIDEQDVTYYSFINSLDSEYTKKYYKFCLEKFLNRYKIDLASLLKLPEDQLTNLIIKYLVETKISKQYKNLLSASLKHACEINDIMLNWKKIKKFINSDKNR